MNDIKNKMTKKEIASLALKNNMQRRKMIICDETKAISRKSVTKQLQDN
jgi:hypothetical protein